MRPISPMLLDDILQAIARIERFTTELTATDYVQNDLVKSAVERQLQITGEAMVRLLDNDPQTASRISDVRRIIGFRNRLAHGYGGQIDDNEVWRIIQESLPILKTEIQMLMSEIE